MCIRDSPNTAPRVSIDRCKPKTFPLVSAVASSESIASLAPVLIPLPNRSRVLAKNTHNGNVKIAIIGLDIALNT